MLAANPRGLRSSVSYRRVACNERPLRGNTCRFAAPGAPATRRRFPTLAPHPWHREVRPEATFLTFNFDVSLLFAIGFANVFILGWLESIADPPMGRNRLLSGGRARPRFTGFGGRSPFLCRTRLPRSCRNLQIDTDPTGSKYCLRLWGQAAASRNMGGPDPPQPAAGFEFGPASGPPHWLQMPQPPQVLRKTVPS